jgi:uncharacterized protein
MKIDNEFTVSVPVDRAWDVLTDLEGVSLCLPGARLTGVEGEVYKGEVRVKVGPVVAEYSGTAQFLEKDGVSHRALIDAKGRDSRGAGNASALITLQLRPDGDRTVVSVDTDMKISGKIAQLGGGMIKDVSQKLLGQFVDCLEAKFAAPAPTETPAVTTPSEAPAEAAPAATPAAPATTPAAAPPAAPAATSAVSAEPLDLVALAGGAMARRLVPALVVLAIVVAVVVYLVVR